MNVIGERLQKEPFLVLDGAFATELERLGFPINDPLWSAVALYKNPELVSRVHHLYLDAGADIAESAGYQASVPGFMKKGFSRAEAERLLRRSVRLVKEACRAHGSDSGAHPLAAASLGPYGAYLADGSEYRGHYDASCRAVADFHRERLAVIAEEEPDLLAFETVPDLLEAEVICEVLEGQRIPAWVSFSCRDGIHTCGGDDIADCAALIDQAEEVAAVGVNCVAPRYAAPLIKRIRRGTDKPIVVYPNSGEVYDVPSGAWTGKPADHTALARQWYEAGARIIGGCCRTTPEDIAGIAAWRRDLRRRGPDRW